MACLRLEQVEGEGAGRGRRLVGRPWRYKVGVDKGCIYLEGQAVCPFKLHNTSHTYVSMVHVLNVCANIPG